MGFQFQDLEISDVKLIKPDVYGDDRGYFLECYKDSIYQQNGINESFVQENVSLSARNVLRGLHYQKDPAAQGKLVKVFQGRIFDVAVDIRRGSKSFGKWVGAYLSDEDHQMIYIPPGFAHGFCVVSDTALISYKVTSEYSPENDRGIIWNDPEIDIQWPIEAIAAIVSEKDSKQPLIKNADINYNI